MALRSAAGSSGGGAAAGITINTSAITGGTTTRLLYDNGGTVGEATATWSSAASTLSLPAAGVFGVLSSAAVLDTGLSRLSSGVIAVGNGASADISGKLQMAQAYVGTAYTADGGGGASLELYADAATAKARTVTSRQNYYAGDRLVNPSNFWVGWSSFTVGSTGTDVFGATDTGIFRKAAGSFAVGTIPSAAITGTILASNAILTGTLTYGGVAAASTITGTGSLVLSASPTFTGTASFAATTQTGLLSAVTSVAISSATAATQCLISGTTTTSFGIYFGNSSAPSFAAAQGSIYMNSGGSSTSTRLYVKASAATTWVNVTTAS
jgi:hypothetical protein